MTRTLAPHPLTVIAGKGGVGRSTIATGLALACARHGERVLLVDAINHGGTKAALKTVSAPAELELFELDTVSALDEYIKIYLRFPIPPSRLGPIARIFEYVATAAPGVTETLAIGKIGHEVREANFDRVIVDAPATGHVVELLRAPQSLAEIVPLGPLTVQMGWLNDILSDPDQTGVWITATPEELPVTEAAELIERLRNETDVGLVGAILNRVPTARSMSPALPAHAARGLSLALELIAEQAERAHAERDAFEALVDQQLPDGMTIEIPESGTPVEAAALAWLDPEPAT